MFKKPNERYMTRGIADTIHSEVALLLWHLIDRLKDEGADLDYLQVFELSVVDDKQIIIHRQEQPPLMEQVIVSDACLCTKLSCLFKQSHLFCTGSCTKVQTNL